MQGRWRYLYRAIDSAGTTVDFLLSALRDADAAKQLFRKALSDQSHPQPRAINTDLTHLRRSYRRYKEGRDLVPTLAGTDLYSTLTTSSSKTIERSNVE